MNGEHDPEMPTGNVIERRRDRRSRFRTAAWRGLALGAGAGLITAALMAAAEWQRAAPVPFAASQSPSQAPVALGALPVALPVGTSLLDSEIQIELPPQGEATAQATPQGTKLVRLLAGTMSLRTLPPKGGALATPKSAGEPSRALEAQAGGYRFLPRHAFFEVELAPQGARLAVHEGGVAVYLADHQLALVKAGQMWSEPRTDLRAGGAGPEKTIPK